MKKKLLVTIVATCIFISAVPYTNSIAYATGGESESQSGMDETDDSGIGTILSTEDDSLVKFSKSIYNNHSENGCGYAYSQGTPKGAAKAITRHERCTLNGTDKAESFSLECKSADAHSKPARAYLCEQVQKSTPRAEELLYAYDLIKKGIQKCDETITVYDPEISEDEHTQGSMEVYVDEVKLAYALVREDYPEYFWLGTSWVYSYYYYEGEDETGDEYFVSDIFPDYIFDEDEIEEAQEKFNQEADDIISRMDAHFAGENIGQPSDYQKELWLHDYLALTNEYIIYTPHAHSAYGAIVEGEAVCEGYTRAFQLLLRAVGIDCRTVSGIDKPNIVNADEDDANHIWNLIKLDGKWYQTDLTWNDQGNEKKDIFHLYFNISQETMLKTHTIVNTEGLPLPELSDYGDSQFYFDKDENKSKSFDCGSWDEQSNRNFVDELVKQMRVNAIGSGDSYYTYACIYGKKEKSDEIVEKLSGNENMQAILEALELESAQFMCRQVGAKNDKEHEYRIIVTATGLSESEYYGILEKGSKDMENVTIRLYKDDFCDDIDFDEKTAEICKCIVKTRKEDNKHVAAAKKDDLKTWYEHKEGETGMGYGTYYTGFRFENVLAGDYLCAVYKEGYGVHIKKVTVGKYGLSENAARLDYENCWFSIYKLGDINDDCSLDFMDTLFIKRHIAGWNGYDKFNRYAADIDNDDTVTLKDLTILERYLAGWKAFADLREYESGAKVLSDSAN